MVLPERSSDLPPPQLFHYSGPAGTYGIVTSRSIWATFVHYLNDAAEFEYGLTLTRGELSKRAKSATQSVALALLHIRDSLSRIARLNVAVFCLSERGDLLSQWRGYCPEGGYSLGFDTTMLQNVISNQQLHLKRCIYQAKEQHQLLQPLIETLIKRIEIALRDEPTLGSVALEGLYAGFANELALILPVIKHPAFAEESEWRIVSDRVSCRSKEIGFRASKNLLIPYLRIDLTSDTFPLTEFIVGPNLLQTLAWEGLTTLLCNAGVDYKRTTASAIPFRLL